MQWCNGYRVDLEALGKLCRECGALLVVDAIQDLGALELVVRRAEIDLLVAGGHKWLNSPFGCGLLYVRRETLPALDPASWGYLGLPEPDGGWPRYFSTPSITPFRPCVLPERRRASRSTAPPMTRARPRSEPRSPSSTRSGSTQSRRRCSASRGRSTRSSSRRRPSHHASGGRCPLGDHDLPRLREPAENETFLDRLLDERIYVSLRYTSGVGGIRVSTHWFNDESDLETLLGAVKRLTARRR